MSKSKQKRTPVFVEDSDEELQDEVPSSRKPKKPTKGGSAAKKPKHHVVELPYNSDDSADEAMIPLSNKRFVSVTEYHGKTMVNIREYYNDQESGELKPGRKGISLNLDQWQKLAEVVPKIQERVKAMS